MPRVATTTDPDKLAKLAAEREKYKAKRAELTPEQIEAKRAQAREAARRRKENETPEQAAHKKALREARNAKETPEQKEARLAKARVCDRARMKDPKFIARVQRYKDSGKTKEVCRKYNETHREQRLAYSRDYEANKRDKQAVVERRAERVADGRTKEDCARYRKKHLSEPSYAVMKFKQGVARRNRSGGFPDKLRLDITEEQMRSIVVQPCYYCGIVPDGFCISISKLDKSMAYTVDNSIPSCSKCCLLASKTNDATQFVQRMITVAAVHTPEAGLPRYPEASSDHPTAGNYVSAAKFADIKNLEFSIPCADYMTLTGQSCYFCNKIPGARHCGGVDRMDNTKGYTLENCIPCCGDCNMSKGTFTFEEFLTYARAIAQTHTKIDLGIKLDYDVHWRQRDNARCNRLESTDDESDDESASGSA